MIVLLSGVISMREGTPTRIGAARSRRQSNPRPARPQSPIVIGRHLDTPTAGSHNFPLILRPSRLPPDKAIPVNPASRQACRRRPRHLLAAAVVLGLGLPALAGRAPAASVSPALEAEAEVEAGSHGCKCGPDCHGSCCCGPHRAPARPSAPEPGRADPRPCLDSAPCGDPGLPGAPSPAPGGKGAALPMLVGPRPGGAGSFLPPSSQRPRPSRRASRLDEPPERADLA